MPKPVRVWIISAILFVLLFGEGGQDEAVEGGGRLGGACEYGAHSVRQVLSIGYPSAIYRLSFG